MAPASESRTPARWHRLMELLKLTGACAAGFAIASWFKEKSPTPSRATSAPSAVRPVTKANPASGISQPLPAHFAAAARVAAALELARTDEAGLRRQLAGITDDRERPELIRGLFAHLADSLPPSDAIREALMFEGADQADALKELAAVWLKVDPKTIDAPNRGSSVVLLAGLNLIYSRNARPGTAEAWVAAFQNHPARLELASCLAGVVAATDPQRGMAMAEGLTPWERQRFHGNVLFSWASKDPDAARRWLTDPANGSITDDLHFPWHAVSDRNPEWVAAALAGERDPEARMEIIRTLANNKAFNGTREALAWADSLSNPAEREAAHDEIYEATPRGIGAVLDRTDGFPSIRSVLPDSAAARAGLQAGDRFLDVTGSDGKNVPLYQQPLEAVLKQFHGESGEPLDVHILRIGPDGKPAEQTVHLVRDQIILPPSTARAENK